MRINLHNTKHESSRYARAFIAVILAVLLVFALAPQPGAVVHASGEAAEQLKVANTLKSLGLFVGSDIGFELERAPTRIEGGVIVVRLLGMEGFSKTQKLKHPYTDVPSWGSPYVGYMYHAGLTKGIGGGLYGSGDLLTFRQIVVFILRALRYYENNDDFTYDTAVQKAVAIGLMSQATADYLSSKPSFTRGDTVMLLYSALKLKLNGTDEKLISVLVELYNAVNATAALNSGLYQQTSGFPKTSVGYKVTSRQQIADIISHTVVRYVSEIRFDTSAYGDLTSQIKSIFDDGYKAAADQYHVGNFISSIYFVQDGDMFLLRFTYALSRYTFVTRLQEMELAYTKADHVLSEIISPSMTEYRKELAIHDYIVNNTCYDTENYEKGSIPWESNTAYGALVLGRAVCGGYADAMNVMAGAAGLECMIVYGTAMTDSVWYGHAWNIIRISGKYYHLDVTYNDPIGGMTENRIIHDYFNLPDSLIMKDHKWDTSKYPACVSMDMNYYKVSGLLVDDYNGFETMVRSAVQQKSPAVEIMVRPYYQSQYNNISAIMSSGYGVYSYWVRKNDMLGVIAINNIKYQS